MTSAPLHVSFEDDRGGNRIGGLLNEALGAQTPETSLRTEMLGRIETISRELDELRNAIEAIKP